MSVEWFLAGAAIAFSFAVPIGPVGILCIRRTLEHGARDGLVVGVSAAFCDAAYSVVAVFGVTLVSDFIALEQHWIRLLGGLILLGIGYATFRARPLAMRPAGTRSSYLWGGCSAALLVFTNPLTLFAYAAAFVVLGVKGTVGNPTIGLMLVAGVFVGSLAWFALLTEVVHWLRARVMRVGLTLVNRVAGVLLMLCSVYVLWNGIRGL